MPDEDFDVGHFQNDHQSLVTFRQRTKALLQLREKFRLNGVPVC